MCLLNLFQDNIIAALNTGSGKTLISILLIKWIAAQEKSKGKAVIFLVPKVTLVDQQKETIQRQTSLKVTKLHGAVEMELSNREGWKKKFESYDVFVMTGEKRPIDGRGLLVYSHFSAQIFVNLITHGLWSMQQISLMIFDECHHARKNDPYNSILREYRHIAPPERPKIFGMTASPIWNVRNPLGSIKLLEDNMNAKVIGVRENIAELLEKSPRPEEVSCSDEIPSCADIDLFSASSNIPFLWRSTIIIPLRCYIKPSGFSIRLFGTT